MENFIMSVYLWVGEAALLPEEGGTWLRTPILISSHFDIVGSFEV